MRGTIMPISGAAKLVSEPSGPRSGDPAGRAASASSSSPATSAAMPAPKPRRSRSVSSSIFGISSGSPSMGVFCRRGSITRSVRYQPTPMTSSDETAVNPRLLSGLTMRSGSRIWAACWVKPCSSGSMPEGMKLAENPPGDPGEGGRRCRPGDAGRPHRR